jgi:hypothetical protein
VSLLTILRRSLAPLWLPFGSLLRLLARFQLYLGIILDVFLLYFCMFLFGIMLALMWD